MRRVVEGEISNTESVPVFYHLLGSRWSSLEKAFDDFDGRFKDLIVTDSSGSRIFVSGVRAPLLERVSIIGVYDSSPTGQRNFFTVTRENRDKIDLYNIFKEGLRNHSAERSDEVGFVLVFNRDITKFGSVKTNLPRVLLNGGDVERKIFRTSGSYEEAIYKLGVNDANNLAGDGTVPSWNPITSKRLQNYAQGKSSEEGLIKLSSESKGSEKFFDISHLVISNGTRQGVMLTKSDKDSLLSNSLKIYRSELNISLKSATKTLKSRTIKRLLLNKTR